MTQFSQFVKLTVSIVMIAICVPLIGYFCLLLAIVLAGYVKNIPNYLIQLPETLSYLCVNFVWCLWWTVTHPIEVVIACAIPIMFVAYYWPDSDGPRFPDRHIHRGSRLGNGPKLPNATPKSSSRSSVPRGGHQPTIHRGSRVLNDRSNKRT